MKMVEIPARLYYPEGATVPPMIQATDYRSEGGKINVQVRVGVHHQRAREDLVFFTAERWEQVDRFARAYELSDDVGMMDAGLVFVSSTRIR